MRQRMKWYLQAGCAAATVSLATGAWAQDTARVPLRQSITDAVVSTLLFGVIGIVLAIVGFKLFDLATPLSLEREICEKQNIAAAIVAAAMVLGICLIIAATVSS